MRKAGDFREKGLALDMGQEENEGQTAAIG